jgi:hypothetical protein
MNAERHSELDRGGVKRVEVGVVEVACLERRRDEGGHQTEIFGFSHDVDRCLPVLDRSHRDTAQPAGRRRAEIRDPVVVEACETGGELRILQAGRAEPEARIQHHRVDVVAVGVAQHAFD